jgi:hypothetical protein
MLVEHPVALARADKNLKKDIPWISVSAVGMFEGCLADIQRIGPMSEVDIFWTSTGLTCVVWVFAVMLHEFEKNRARKFNFCSFL